MTQGGAMKNFDAAWLAVLGPVAALLLLLAARLIAGW